MASKDPRNNDNQYKEEELPHQPFIQSLKLKGHSGSVLCLDHSDSASNRFIDSGNSSSRSSSVVGVFNSTLLSGSEDGTCRLWDLRTGIRASLCIRSCTNSTNECRDVLSVSFGPTSTQQVRDSSDDDVGSPFAREYSVYTSVRNNVYGYDLRNISSPIITIPSTDFTFLECSDEINQIALASIRNRLTPTKPNLRDNRSNNHLNTDLLAVADDSGTIRVTDFIHETKNNGNDRARKSVFIHNETALATSIAYCPKSRLNGQNGNNRKQQPVVLASGGTDCCIHLWDVGFNSSSNDKHRSTVPLCSVSIPQTQEQSNQICNPPMVHCLQWSPSGKILVAGLGDGSIALLHHPTISSLILSHRVDDAHSGTVASCLFPAWTSKMNDSISTNSCAAITAHDRLLCTTGNDGCIALWDLGANIGGDKSNNPTSLFPIDDNVDIDMKMSSRKESKTKAAIDSFIDVPQTLFAFQHTEKPNWMVNSGSNDTSFPYSFFVADVSHDITAYTIPIR